METVLFGEKLYKKIDTLKEVRVDSEKWEIYYIDEATGEKWLQEYPNSEYHGGGAPLLRLVDKFPFE